MWAEEALLDAQERTDSGTITGSNGDTGLEQELT